MRVSSAAGMFERIKTHQCSFYTRMQRNKQSHSRARRTRSRSHNEPNTIRVLAYQTTALPKLVKIGYRFLGTYQVCPGTNLSFKPLLALHKEAIPPQSMMRCPRRLIRPHPLRSTTLLKWIHSPESKSSTPLEETLVRGTSHVLCNPLTLPNTRT
ncbi:hypothetical protein M9H77_23511 [Catharanthus roseus]|uniref:Uncharacterized protein n=1 Tax=Catharanthus roseus TaxID=4058 RepID=A0ACC0AWD5_CATRO|nr:hypothetical protein M9H77_23511 [Catharanthus roseus]